MGQGEGSQDWAVGEGIEEEDGGQCGSQDSLGKGGGSARGECDGVVVCWSVESILEKDVEVEELAIEYEDVEVD